MINQPMAISELLALLGESQELLDEAIQVEPGAAASPARQTGAHSLGHFARSAGRNHLSNSRIASTAELADLLTESKQYFDRATGVAVAYPTVSPEVILAEAVADDVPPFLAQPEPATDDSTSDDAALEEALRQCQAAAEAGYQKAMAHVTTLDEVFGRIQTESDHLVRACEADGDNDEFRKKIEQILQDLNWERSRLRYEVEDKRKNLNQFNITLFGRTMTGKSTLMEILTRGDGSSIGKGAQRTTRDVRSYEWKGLTVTDVPGIAAYKGEDDAQTAHHATNQADLVMFLISDDGPQTVETEHLARLRQQGKSLLGIFNVKGALNDDRRIRRFIRDQQKEFDPARLSEIRRQFDEMIAQYVPGQKLELVSAHLLARYLAGRPQNAGKPWRDDLEQASRFRDAEERILREVTGNGPFLRTNSFLNIGSAANLQAWEAVRASVDLCEQVRHRLSERLRDVRSWQDGFRRRANQQIDWLVQQTVGGLRNQIPSFASDNCENNNASHHWNVRVRNAGIDPKCQALQRQLAGECQSYFKQLAADTQQEIRLLENRFHSVSMETGPITDTRGRWNWGAVYAGTALGGFTGGLFLSGVALSWNPLGWALLGAGAIVGIAGLVGNLFKSRDQKRREAIAKITPLLRQNVDDIERQVRDGMAQWLDDFSKQCLNQAERQFNQLVQTRGKMADLMRNIENRQRESLLAVNRDTVEQALRHLGKADDARRMHRVARIPGVAVVLTTTGSNNLSHDAVAGLGTLLQEQAVQVSDQMAASGIRNALKSLNAATSERLAAQLT